MLYGVRFFYCCTVELPFRPRRSVSLALVSFGNDRQRPTSLLVLIAAIAGRLVSLSFLGLLARLSGSYKILGLQVSLISYECFFFSYTYSTRGPHSRVAVRSEESVVVGHFHSAGFACPREQGGRGGAIVSRLMGPTLPSRPPSDDPR